ncbi:GfV-C14-ORF2 [Ichnoviriform fumiferanae]|uniref:GfV-C14-ORF2 n=1 Tax=Ichnoviriform fumiferanae TaxID=419435 RepID=A2PZY0_9VIRU|nr:GfV-C14-ORF2 [Ichnoviriform fumiferanae]BAF45552.1 GfV-C14-ORF2 [Ichnoviriform fumiferanae]
MRGHRCSLTIPLSLFCIFYRAINIKMFKSTMSVTEQNTLDTLVVKLNDLNAEIKYLNSCQYLTMAEEIAKILSIWRKKRLLNKVCKLIRDSKNNSAHMQDDAH